MGQDERQQGGEPLSQDSGGRPASEFDADMGELCQRPEVIALHRGLRKALEERERRRR